MLSLCLEFELLVGGKQDKGIISQYNRLIELISTVVAQQESPGFESRLLHVLKLMLQLPPTVQKHTWVGLTSNSKLAKGVNGGLSVCVRKPVKDAP